MVVILLNACSTVVIPNEEFCGDLKEDGATCFHTLSKDTRNIPKAQWDIERFGEICEKPQVFTDIKSGEEKLCSLSGKCTYQNQEALSAFIQKTQNVRPAPHGPGS